MWTGTLTTDFNGLVLFEPTLLLGRYGSSLVEGTDLFTKYRTSEEGDAVLAAGLVVPVIAIDDDTYDVVVRYADEPNLDSSNIVVENGEFALHVARRLVAADLACLKEWIPELGWQDIPVEPGSYSVTVRGFRCCSAQGHIERAGYEFILSPLPHLPVVTANLSMNMRVLDR